MCVLIWSQWCVQCNMPVILGADMVSALFVFDMVSAVCTVQYACYFGCWYGLSVICVLIWSQWWEQCNGPVLLRADMVSALFVC
jgi:Na+-translocating ferredoxin:NAD+ oxidoreductase RnfD subunit